jgi:hypothetical protein
MSDTLLGSEVPTAMVRKGSVFWDIAPYIPLETSDVSE